MEHEDQPVRFEMAGVEAEDPLGLWAAVPAGPVHFGMDDGTTAPPPDTPVYRVQLSEDIAEADVAFRAREASLERSAHVLDAIPSRLDDLVARTQVQQKAGGNETVQFGIDEVGTGKDPAETELLNLLAEVDAAPSTGGQVEFGLVDEGFRPVIEQAETQLRALLHQVNREILHFAWVETATRGHTLARTTVNWSGNAETVWMDDISQEQSVLHNRSLRFATRSRAVKMRMAMTITGGAAKVAALMTNPVGAVLALPVVYRYVNQMLAQTRELQALSESISNPSV